MDTQHNAAVSLQQVVDEQQQKLKEKEDYIKALVEEFTQCSDLDEARATFRNKIKEFAPQALVNIINLAMTAESESVRASLNKWVLDWTMSDKIDSSGSELTTLLNQLKAKPAQAPNETATTDSTESRD